jgi:hypothetical protein
MNMNANNPNEKLGPAERIIQTVLAYSDHMVHNRPGVLTKDPGSAIGVKWTYVTHKVEPKPGAAPVAAAPAAPRVKREKGAKRDPNAPKVPKVKRPPIPDGIKVVYQLTKAGKKTIRTRLGVLQDDGKTVKADNGVTIGEYRPAGLFPEVAAWMYKQVADVWKIDNEFAARWASYAFGQEHRDLKVILAAFMLVQSRKGDPVLDGGKVAFLDEDYRDVGEAMMLIREKGQKDLNPKLLLRIRDLLTIPAVAEVNRELGFGRSARKPFYGRWEKAVEKWLRHREENPKLLQGLVKAGFRSTVMELACAIGYKPETPKFFEILRWKQAQAKDGRRALDIGKAVTAAETWEGFTEQQICETIVRTKPNYKRVIGLIPKAVGLTRAIVAATIEAGGFSNKDLIQFTPTLEELGLLNVQDVRERWEKAMREADDMRAANIALRVKSKAVAEKLQDAADTAIKAAVAEVVKGLRIYVVVDRSGSMDGAIEAAKSHIGRFLQGFPADKLHVSIFNTVGREVQIKHASAAGVENAFRGIQAEGGTNHADGVKVLSKYKPADDEDVLMIFIGDEEDSHQHFVPTVQASGLRPMAFGLVRVLGRQSHGRGMAVRNTAQLLGIPCFQIDEKTFADPYAIPRTIRNLVAATPVGAVTTAAPQRVRETLVDTILKTDVLKKPAWAA